MPDHPKDDPIDWKALKRQSQRPASPQPAALQPALEFLQDDLAPMISRLAELAADLLSKAGVLEQTRTGASKLAQRLGRLAGLLACSGRSESDPPAALKLTHPTAPRPGPEGVSGRSSEDAADGSGSRDQAQGQG